MANGKAFCGIWRLGDQHAINEPVRFASLELLLLYSPLDTSLTLPLLPSAYFHELSLLTLTSNRSLILRVLIRFIIFRLQFLQLCNISLIV
jgi:hypothetical protein